MDALEEDASTCEPNELIHVRYQDLQNNPLETLKKIYSQLELSDFETDKPIFENYLSGIEDYRKNTYHYDADLIALVRERWGKYIKHWDYPDTPDQPERD